MKEKSRVGTVGVIRRIVAAALAAAAVIVVVSWWQMPYLHHDWYGEDLNIILHIITFALCPVLCVLTFLFAEKKKALCIVGGAAVLALAVVSTLLNDGFVPYAGTLVIGLIAILYLIAALLAARPEKPEKLSPDELARKFKTARTLAIVSGAAAAFSVVFPKKAEVFSQHMSEDGPGVIEYYAQYTPFGIVLLALIPVFLILLIVFAIRAGLLRGRLRDVRERESHER